MTEFLSTLVIIFSVFLVSFFLLNLRHIFTGNEFRGTCSTNNPMIKDKIGDCPMCGKTGDEVCQNEEVELESV